MTSAAAVVVRWRGGDEVARCLQSLFRHGGEELSRVVLVDSGSADGGAERLADQFPNVELLALAENRSFAWAADQGASLCREPQLLLVNPDTELTPGCLASLQDELQRRPHAAGAVPLLIDADGFPQHRWQLRRLPRFVRLAAGMPGTAVSSRPPSEVQPVEQPAAAAWLVRREVWDGLDGLDPSFAPAWWEDVDFCARLAERLGQQEFPVSEGFWAVPAARMLHVGGASRSSLSDAAFLAAYYGNLLRYAERHHARHLGGIRAGLRMSLLGRALLRPSLRRAYLDTLKTLRRTHQNDLSTDA